MNEYCLPVEDVVRLNHQLIGRDGNLLDRSKLESALATPLQTFGGEYWHPSALDRAAALLHYLAKAHAFVDGNKRIAWVCASTYLEIEGFGLGQSPMKKLWSSLKPWPLRAIRRKASLQNGLLTG